MTNREDITDVNVRIFRGKENLVVSPSQDFLHILFRLHTTVRPQRFSDGIDQIKIRNDKEVLMDPFCCKFCVPGRFLEAISFLKLFLQEVNRERVAQEISTNLLSCYSFDARKSYPDIPKLVIMIEVHVVLAVSDEATFSKIYTSTSMRNTASDHRPGPRVQGSCLIVELSDKLKVLKENLGLLEVEAAIKIFSDGSRNRNNIHEDVCAICLEQLSVGSQIAETPCSHVFHKICVFKWLPGRGTCPLCRSICTTSL